MKQSSAPRPRSPSSKRVLQNSGLWCTAEAPTPNFFLDGVLCQWRLALMERVCAAEPHLPGTSRPFSASRSLVVPRMSFHFSCNGLMVQGTQRFLTYRGASLLQEQTPAWKPMTLPSRPCRCSCPACVHECWVNPKARLYLMLGHDTRASVINSRACAPGYWPHRRRRRSRR